MQRGEHTKKERRVEWYTPPRIFEMIGWGFDLDVCSPGLDVTPWVPAQRALTRDDDGLKAAWRGFVWCNPPYDRSISSWLARFRAHDDGLCLVFARPGAAWFQDHVLTSPPGHVLWLKQRIRFIPGEGQQDTSGPGSDNILLAGGARAARVLQDIVARDPRAGRVR